MFGPARDDLKRLRRDGGESVGPSSKRHRYSASSDQQALQEKMLLDYIILLKGAEGGEGGEGLGKGCGFCLALTGLIYGGEGVHNALDHPTPFTREKCPQFTQSSNMKDKFMHWKCIVCLVRHDGAPSGCKPCPLRRQDKSESKSNITALKESFKKCEACHIRDMTEFKKTDFHTGSQFGFRLCKVAGGSDVILRLCVALFRRKPKVLLVIVGGRRDFDDLGKGTRTYLEGIKREKLIWWSDQAMIAQQGVNGSEFHDSLPPFYDYYGSLYKDWYPGGPFTNASVIFLVFLKYFQGTDSCAEMHLATFNKIRELEQ